MKDLIEALTIFSKYTDEDVIHCEHDTLYVCVSPSLVSAQDNVRLDQLGFFPNASDGNYQSFRFGSC